MNNIVITVGSVTYAIKLRKIFLREGISTRLVRLDTTDLGCTHGLEISESDYYSAVVILKNNKIGYKVISQK